MSEQDDFEARFRRSLLMRRLVIGVGALAFGLCSLALAALALFGARVQMAFGGFAAGVGACAVGFVTLRRGEVDLSTGELYEGEPVPVKLIALATSGVVVALSALLAWPLGAYGWLSDQLSPCHALVSLDLLSELSESDLEVGEVHDSEGRCLLRLEDGARLPAVTIIVHDDDWSEGYARNRRTVREVTAIDGLAAEAVRGRRGGYYHVGYREDPVGGGWIQLREDLFGEPEVDAVIEAVRASR